jgi:hypothetical protein
MSRRTMMNVPVSFRPLVLTCTKLGSLSVGEVLAAFRGMGSYIDDGRCAGHAATSAHVGDLFRFRCSRMSRHRVFIADSPAELLAARQTSVHPEDFP